MRLSELFAKTKRASPKDEESKNAQLLERAGFIQKLSAGVYTFLPLGLRVLNKIENIVREEMNKAGGVEILMPALHPKEIWEATGRWQSFGALFKTESAFGGQYALGPTHEEVLYSLLRNHISSYRDLPVCVYQIQTKFRDEKRAKAGLLRGMEFQVPCESGEDVVYLCKKCNEAVNKELAGSAPSKCRSCGGGADEIKTIEVGNIFPLKEKFAKDFNLSFKDKNG